MPSITVFIKNLAGDLLPLDVEPTLSLFDVATRLSLSSPDMYPMGRVHLFRMTQEEEEKQKESDEKTSLLEEDEILCALVLEPLRWEKGTFPEKEGRQALYSGMPYTQFLIPFRGRTLYLYLLARPIKTYTYQIHFAMSWTPCMENLQEALQAMHHILYRTIQTMIPDVTVEEMKMLYDIIHPYCKELGKEDGYTYRYTIYSAETIQCECGSVIKRSSLRSHLKTQWHKMCME